MTAPAFNAYLFHFTFRPPPPCFTVGLKSLELPTRSEPRLREMYCISFHVAQSEQEAEQEAEHATTHRYAAGGNYSPRISAMLFRLYWSAPDNAACM